MYNILGDSLRGERIVNVEISSLNDIYGFVLSLYILQLYIKVTVLSSILVLTRK